MKKIETFIRGELQPYIDSLEEAELGQICEKVIQKFNVPCAFKFIGGFDSPGYEIRSYAISYYAGTGEVKIIEYNYEFY